MKKIIIHAGLPKTGSTFLQENIFPGLPADLCAYNPEKLRRMLVEMCKKVIVQGALSEDEVEELRRRVNNEISQIEQDALLISIEGFLPVHLGTYVYADNILGVLKKLTPDATIVIYLREQSAWIRSAYSFCLVSKYILPFDEFVSRDRDGNLCQRSGNHLSLSVYNYPHQTVRDLAKRHFQDVHCFCFEKLFSHQESELEKLAKIIGVPRLTARASDKVNKGLDERLMLIVSAVLGWIPFRSCWRTDFFYPRYSKMGLLDRLNYYYLRRSGLLAMMIARVLYRCTNMAKNQRLFTDANEADIKSFYRSSNEEFWTTADRA